MFEQIKRHQESIDERDRTNQCTSALLLTGFIAVSTLSILEYSSSRTQGTRLINDSAAAELDSKDMVLGATHLAGGTLAQSSIPGMNVNIPLECVSGEGTEKEKMKCIIWRDFCMKDNPSPHSVQFCGEVFLWNIGL